MKLLQFGRLKQAVWAPQQLSTLHTHLKQHFPLGQGLPPLHLFGVQVQVSQQGIREPAGPLLDFDEAIADDAPSTSAPPMNAAVTAPTTPARRRKWRRSGRDLSDAKFSRLYPNCLLSIGFSGSLSHALPASRVRTNQQLRATLRRRRPRD